MTKIIKAVPLEGYRLKIRFRTGEEGIFDMNNWLDGPIYSKLRDRDMFNHVAIDEIAGTICWPNGIDVCPDVVYEQTKFSSSKNTSESIK